MDTPRTESTQGSAVERAIGAAHAVHTASGEVPTRPAVSKLALSVPELACPLGLTERSVHHTQRAPKLRALHREQHDIITPCIRLRCHNGRE
jgi:hypothetical protein